MEGEKKTLQPGAKSIHTTMKTLMQNSVLFEFGIILIIGI